MIHGVYPAEHMSPVIEEVVSDPKAMMMVTNKNKRIKIVQDKKSWEEEPGAPERIRNPVIQIIIVPWRRIIGYNRGSFFVVIIVDFLWLNVFAACRGLIFRVLAGSWRDH